MDFSTSVSRHFCSPKKRVNVTAGNETCAGREGGEGEEGDRSSDYQTECSHECSLWIYPQIPRKISLSRHAVIILVVTSSSPEDDVKKTARRKSLDVA